MNINIEKDKLYHLLAGFAITLIVGLLIDIRTGIALGILSGLGKEIFDYFDYGVFDKMDVFFTWIGTIIAGGLLVALI